MRPGEGLAFTKISFSRADMERQIIQAAYTKSLYGGMERTTPALIV